jgi:aminopeptidase N
LRSTRFGILFFLCGLGLLVPAAAGAAREPFFPAAGSRAYDVRGYGVHISYRPQGPVRGVIAIRARAMRPLAQFSLDFLGPRVRQVAVDGKRASYERKGGKLRIVPAEGIPRGPFETVVRYAGTPPKVTDPDGSQEGWFRTDDGVLAVGEPQGTAAWIPCNNTPVDKAWFRFDVVVPDGLKAVANGRLREVEHGAGRSRFSWVEAAPMSPYLAVLDIGRGRLVKDRIGRIPTWTLIDPRLRRYSLRPLAALPEVLRFQARLFGGYPFSSAGSIVDYAPSLGYALETQSRPIYAFVPDLTTIVHETAHQWFGDSVGMKRWPEIWLAEGFATWTEWYYAERHGGRGAQAIFRRLHRVPASNDRFWNPPPGRPGSAGNLFDPSVYVRGAMALQALREKIGSGPMLRLLRRWAVEHRHGSATVREFVDLAEEMSGRELDPFFQRWLYQRGKPR